MAINYQVKRNKMKNAVGLYDKGANYNKSVDNLTRDQKLMKGIAKWTAFYRARPDIFVKDYLGITLNPFQRILICQMMHNNYTMFLASRGLGKSFLTAVYCVVRCILYPGTKIVVASGTKEQAMNLIVEKIPELMQISSNGNLAREIDGSIKTSMNTPDPNVIFLNGSWIKAVAANQNARSKRCNLLILDEFRMIDKLVYKNVLRRFLAVSRQAGFMRKPQYKNKKKYQERNQEIFLSSCWYKSDWSYDRYRIFFKNMTKGKKYFVCGLPYQFAIKEGLTNREQLIDELQEDDIDEIGWEMEMNCMFVGETEKAYFKFDDLSKNRKLVNPIYTPQTYEQIKGLKKQKEYIKKGIKEIRLLCCDIALMSGKTNDASVFSILRLLPKHNYYERQLVYMETMEGVHSELQAIRIRQMFNDFCCDYIVLDTGGTGVSVYEFLVRTLFDRERGIEYSPISCINDSEMASRCWDDKAPKIIYSIKATAKFNSLIAIKLKDKFKSNKFKLLINDLEAKDMLKSQIKGFLLLDVSLQIELLAPFVQTTLLINEMINLSNEGNSDIIKLVEPSSGRKDRYSSVVYGNYIGDVLENKLQKRTGHDFDWRHAPSTVSSISF